MQIVDLQLGCYDQAAVLYHVISIEFGIEPPVHNLEELSAFLQRNIGLFINIHYPEKLQGDAARNFSDILTLLQRIKEENGSDYIDYAINPRQQVVLDFSKCADISDAYREMRQKMQWEDWYGNNADALWDILTGLPYYGDDFHIIKPQSYPNSDFCMQINKICQIFTEVQSKHGNIRVAID